MRTAAGALAGKDGDGAVCKGTFKQREPVMQRGILLFGYPGSGKGTQGKILSALPGFHHVAMGDILRAVTPANPLHERLQSYLRRGDLVPDELVMDLFFGHIDSLKPAPEDFLIIDGIPRNAVQTELLNQKIRVIKIFKLSVYDERLVIERLRKRARDQNRPDDASDEVIQHRLGVYRQETESCIKSYPGTILTRIQANQPIFDVHLDVMHALGKMRNIQFR
jgi:adenylate kinase